MMMKHTLVLALCMVLSTANLNLVNAKRSLLTTSGLLTARAVDEKRVKFKVCRPTIAIICCSLEKEKTCEFTEKTPTSVIIGNKEKIHPIDDGKKKDGFEIEKEDINLTRKVKLVMVKFNPPNSVFANEDGEFCICPSEKIEASEVINKDVERKEKPDNVVAVETKVASSDNN